MNTNHNRIKVADLEINEPNKILTTNTSGELEFSDINNIKTDCYNALDYSIAGKALDARQGKILKDLIDNINALLASDNVNLDTVQELVDAIETVQISLSTILVNDLSTGGTTKALTAEMGKTLKGLVDALSNIVSGKQNTLAFSTDIEADKTSTTKVLAIKTLYDWAVAKFVQITNIKTVNGNSLIGTGNITTPDMDTTTTQNVSGMKTFLAGMFGLRNTANTFTSFFASAVTASRTWTWPDKSGIVAMTSDVFGGSSNTIYVDTINGNDSTAIPFNPLFQYKTLNAALTAYQANVAAIQIELTTSGTYIISQNVCNDTTNKKAVRIFSIATGYLEFNGTFDINTAGNINNGNIYIDCKNMVMNTAGAVTCSQTLGSLFIYIYKSNKPIKYFFGILP